MPFAAQALRVNYYYSLVWDNRSALATPEWRARDRAGNPVVSGYWPWMCMNTPYLDQVVRENEEIVNRFQVDGAWWDILFVPEEGCFCAWCVADRKKLGLGDTPQDIFHHNKLVALKTERALYDLLERKQPETIAFFNGRTVVGMRDELEYFTDLQIESLPTGGWGYTHFEHRVRYCKTLGKQLVGMTGRFHKSWGDFGGFKAQAALNFECLNFLANGTQACIGDQLHPRGKLDEMTYAMIGQTYELVKRHEDLVRGMKGVADIGVVSVLATQPVMTAQILPPSDEGMTNMLVELHYQFDVLDLQADLTPYKLIILPDEVKPLPALVEKVRKYLEGGGSLLVTHKSFLLEDQGRFALDEIGVTYGGASKFKGEYMLLQPESFPDVGQAAYYLYQQGLSVAAKSGGQMLAAYGHPYFDRSPEHWCSHAQTPVDTITTEPVIVRNGRVTYVANPFFRSYAEDAALIQKLVVKELIRHHVPEPAVREVGVPSTARLTLLQGEPGGRQLVQMLYAPYERRAPNIDVIEEFASFGRAQVHVRRSSAPRQTRAMDAAGNISTVPFLYEEGYVKVNLPRVTGQLTLMID
jgi:hypothetical protein